MFPMAGQTVGPNGPKFFGDPGVTYAKNRFFSSKFDGQRKCIRSNAKIDHKFANY